LKWSEGGEKFGDLKRKKGRKDGNFFSEIKERSGLVRVLSVWFRLKHYTCQDTFLLRFSFMITLA
jgi:hypothetical protein